MGISKLASLVVERRNPEAAKITSGGGETP
jgi:hypothetical protein